jgi:hypothetical protein
MSVFLDTYLHLTTNGLTKQAILTLDKVPKPSLELVDVAGIDYNKWQWDKILTSE